MTCIMERDGRPAWQEGGAVERGGGENPGGRGVAVRQGRSTWTWPAWLGLSGKTICDTCPRWQFPVTRGC